MNDKNGAKERILETVVDLLMEGVDAARVSNREIAARAGVNSALINYYFQSKDYLLGMAADVCMETIAGTLRTIEEGLLPAERIKVMLKRFTAFCLNNIALAEIAVKAELKQVSINTSELLMPSFREYFGERKTEGELRLLTFQLLHPMQILFVNRKEYQRFLPFDLATQSAWDHIVEELVDNLFGKCSRDDDKVMDEKEEQG